MGLGKLKEVDLRSIWKNEASDFTNWLAQEENLRLLSDEIGIDIKLLRTEANVGTFSVDILAEEENTGRKVIVENQLEITDHDHLGKLLTYASGYDADIILWVVKNVRDEHRQAIDWLNEHTDDKLNFFIIKMELWQIGDSPVAPKFQIISKPNDWAKTIKESGVKSELSETKVMQFDFWNKFREYASGKGANLKLRKPYPQHWYDISIGNSKAYLSLVASPTDDFIRCSLYIPNSKETFVTLFKEKEKIENELGEKLEWQELPESKASRIKIEKSANVADPNEWEKHFEWLRQQANLFQNVFTKYLKA
jgi:hypothetical protein